MDVHLFVWQVINLCFEYLSLLQSKTKQERFWSEIKQITWNEFQWMETVKQPYEF